MEFNKISTKRYDIMDGDDLILELNLTSSSITNKFEIINF